MKYQSITAVVQVDSEDSTNVRINFGNGITKKIPSFIYPDYIDLTELYAAINTSQIVKNDMCYLAGFLKKVTQEDVDNAGGGAVPNPPTNGIVDDENKTFTFTASI